MRRTQALLSETDSLERGIGQREDRRQVCEVGTFERGIVNDQDDFGSFWLKRQKPTLESGWKVQSQTNKNELKRNRHYIPPLARCEHGEVCKAGRDGEGIYIGLNYKTQAVIHPKTTRKLLPTRNYNTSIYLNPNRPQHH